MIDIKVHYEKMRARHKYWILFLVTVRSDVLTASIVKVIVVK
jgi:hypothetical protein